jgi:hypothetical protein
MKKAIDLFSSMHVLFSSSVFNAVIRMNLTLMAPALQKFVGLPPLTDLQEPTLPSKDNNKWRKIRLEVKSYLKTVLQVNYC